MHLSLRYRNALHLANTYARTETSRAGKQTVIEKSGLDREFKNCSPFSLSVLNSVIDVFLITFSQTHLTQFSCKRTVTNSSMRRKLEAKWYCIFAFRPTVHLYASFAALALVVQECRYHYPTDQALYTRYEMAKLKYRAFLIPHRIVNCSFSSSRIYLVRTERPVMPYEYCKCLQLLDFKRAKSLAHARIISFSLAEEQINIQSVTGQKPWKRSKDQGIHPPVHC